jgi:hypothetical protein
LPGLLCQSSRTEPAKEGCALFFPFATSETAAVQVLPTAPALRQPRGGRDWLAARAAAMVLDPLCGTAPGIHFTPACLRSGLIATVAERGNRSRLCAISMTGFEWRSPRIWLPAQDSTIVTSPTCPRTRRLM